VAAIGDSDGAKTGLVRFVLFDGTAIGDAVGTLVAFVEFVLLLDCLSAIVVVGNSS